MDFTLSPVTEALRDLATEILEDRSTPDRLGALAREGRWWDLDTHARLVDAGVVGAVVPEELGGAGLGYLDLHHVLLAVGATVAQVPLWEDVVLGALPLVRHGSPEQQQRLLPDLVAGRTHLTAALLEPGSADPLRPETTARATGDGWEVSGTKTQVTLAPEATRVLVAARVAEGPGTVLLLVDPTGSGVSLETQETVAGRPTSRMTLETVAVGADDVLGTAGSDSPLEDVVLHASAGLASIAAGVAGRALRLAASYTSGRDQFGQPLATFQAVRQRLADAYIDVEAMRLTSLQAAWRLDADLDAQDAVQVAKFWAGDAGHRVVHTAQHVHGGMGIDLDYELHRCYRMAKWVEFTLGAGNQQLRHIGRRLAEQTA
ncbi:acyl-CoA dehydrogenase family protein [Nocardioides deserti]|uniref:Acyl-CoA/acyl-ACP dehydrogenase n=1 Tax=Nocardioides deserti TaxID=1588644 RepID=A0ABR6U7X4_9ACTN|nr:acyl-CoA dehydrogenase family protein [Nocardioides deserti]MBC2960069.1 acyl-CoA/acyl-ACP dehydrogenase [Nocardioides deserti]GGO75023.1 acyl-CoA dehydrogenase [Nocardioides deserti]